jgi:hypothetical protein
MSIIISTSPVALALEKDEVEVKESIFECPICYVDVESTSTAVAVSTSCQHQICTPCLVRWIEKEETAGQEAPTCPICRVIINEDDVYKFIGRLFAPREVGLEEANSEEIDDFTLHWLNVNTVLCQGCGSRIEKESGCDLIECLCGYRFCYQCNSPGGRCECNEGHGFLGLEWASREEYIIRPIRDADGCVNLKSCIERRNLKLAGQGIHLDRQYTRLERWEESEMFWRSSGDALSSAEIGTCHGGWIFSCPTDQKSKSKLTYLFESIEAGWIRRSSRNPIERWTVSYEDSAVGSTWLFLQQGADLRALKQLQNRCNVRNSRYWYRASDEELCHSVKMLQQLFDGIGVRRQRCEMRADNEEAPFENGAWLFPQNEQ